MSSPMEVHEAVKDLGGKMGSTFLIALFEQRAKITEAFGDDPAVYVAYCLEAATTLMAGAVGTAVSAARKDVVVRDVVTKAYQRLADLGRDIIAEYGVTVVRIDAPDDKEKK